MTLTQVIPRQKRRRQDIHWQTRWIKDEQHKRHKTTKESPQRTAETSRTESSSQEVEVKGVIDIRILSDHVGWDERIKLLKG